MSPTAPRQPCAEPGCRVLVARGRCPEHARAVDLRRGTRQSRGYDARHDRWRELVLARDALCVTCGAPATDADHIVPLRAWERDHAAAAMALVRHWLAITMGVIHGVDADGRPWIYLDDSQWALDAWSLANGQGLCASCHSRKTARETGLGGRR